MSDSTGMANLAYLPLVGEIPATAEAQRGITTSAQQRRVERVFRYSEHGLEGESWHESKGSPNDWPISREELMRLAPADVERKTVELVAGCHWGLAWSLPVWRNYRLLGERILGSSQPELQPPTGSNSFLIPLESKQYLG